MQLTQTQYLTPQIFPCILPGVFTEHRTKSKPDYYWVWTQNKYVFIYKYKYIYTYIYTYKIYTLKALLTQKVRLPYHSFYIFLRYCEAIFFVVSSYILSKNGWISSQFYQSVLFQVLFLNGSHPNRYKISNSVYVLFFTSLILQVIKFPHNWY